jgi:ketosteroid isomerase-like protein
VTAGDDRWALFDLVARFDDAVNRLDVAEFATLWTEDAVWAIGDPLHLRVEGRDAIVATWSGQLGKVTWLFRGSFAGLTDIKGDHATGRWPCVETGAWTDGRGYDNRSYYDDEYRRVGGRWLFARRRYVYLWLSEATVGGAPIPHPPPAA